MKEKRPKLGGQPREEVRYGGEPSGGKSIRREKNPDSIMVERPAWAFSIFDWDGPWGVRALVSCDYRKHVEKHLSEFERMTWGSITAASGGKTKGTNNHSLSIGQLSRKARDRLEETGQQRLEEVYSLRLEGTVRVYGVREGRVLRIMWIDPWHGDNGRAVCPASKRHT